MVGASTFRLEDMTLCSTPCAFRDRASHSCLHDSFFLYSPLFLLPLSVSWNVYQTEVSVTRLASQGIPTDTTYTTKTTLESRVDDQKGCLGSDASQGMHTSAWTLNRIIMCDACQIRSETLHPIVHAQGRMPRLVPKCWSMCI